MFRAFDPSFSVSNRISDPALSYAFKFFHRIRKKQLCAPRIRFFAIPSFQQD